LITAEKSIIVSSPSNMDLYSGFTKIFENQGAALTFLNQRSDVTRKFSRSGLRKGTLEPGMKEVKGDQAEDPAQKQHKMDRQTSIRREAGDRGARSDRAWKERQWGRAKTGSFRRAADRGPTFRRQLLQRPAQRIKDDDLASASLFILGADNPILRRLGMDMPPIETGFGMIVQKNPLNPTKVVAVAMGRSKEEIELAQGKITDLRKYSMLTFNRGVLVGKMLENTDHGIRKEISVPSPP
jgi:hypothetical protein